MFWYNGWTPGVGDGQGGLASCDSWGCKESDTTEWLNWTELKTNLAKYCQTSYNEWYFGLETLVRTLGASILQGPEEDPFPGHNYPISTNAQGPLQPHSSTNIHIFPAFWSLVGLVDAHLNTLNFYDYCWARVFLHVLVSLSGLLFWELRIASSNTWPISLLKFLSFS